MLYDGSVAGMADPIVGKNNDADYLARADAICDLFNSQYWEIPDATIRRGMPVNRLMVTNEDALELARWLWSRFFDSDPPSSEALRERKPLAPQPESLEIDPADLPAELDAANVAFRAVTNGHGDPAATPRNRLIDYLEKNFPDFKPEQVQRIATVANPDKSTGRKKSAKE
jgi:hypothetical protein